MMIVLLFIIRRTAINPAVKLSHALETVAKGDLNVKMEHHSGDEFGVMSTRFNEMITGLKEKLHLSRYVSTSTMDAVADAVKSGEHFHKPRRKKTTVFFSDIRGFTAYSENKDPVYIIGILNKILSLQVGLIKKYNGYIDKFVGDETMAVFNNPPDAINCAIHIQYNILKSPADFDHLKLGIGIYEGTVVEGDVGSQDTKDFTMIGDTVNTASRLQAVALGGEIIVPEFIITSEEVKTLFKFKLKGNIKLKGKEKELALYKISGTRG